MAHEREAEERKMAHEREAEERKMVHERDMKQLELQGQRQPRDIGAPPVMFPKYSEGEDIDLFLRTFEKLCNTYKVAEESKTARLASLLCGKALEAYSRLGVEESRDYNAVKNAILRRYNLTPEAYRLKFRGIKKRTDETYCETIVVMSEYYDRWMEGSEANDVESIRDVILREQFIRIVPEDLKIWLLDRKPSSVTEAAKLADQYLLVRPKKKPYQDHQPHNQDPKRDQKNGQINREEKTGNSEKQYIPLSERVCYTCGKKGHIASTCKHNKSTSKEVKSGSPESTKALHCTVKSESKALRLLSPYVHDVDVNGKKVKGLRDSACTQTLVHKELVDSDQYMSEQGEIDGILKAPSQHLPLAKVNLSCVFKTGQVVVGCHDKFPEGIDVLLGNDLDPLAEKGLACVTTRSQTKKGIKDSEGNSMEIKNPLITTVDEQSKKS